MVSIWFHFRFVSISYQPFFNSLLAENSEFQNEMKTILNITDKKQVEGSTLLASMSRPDDGLPDEPQPYVCFSKYNVSADPNKFYGLFSRTIIPKFPLANISISGNNWIKHGDTTHLDFKCDGTPTGPFRQCYRVYPGIHNVTTNESCAPWVNTSTCGFDYQRFIYDQKPRTIVVFFENDINVRVSKAVVNYYEVKAHSPLSVIVVPVSCVLFAVIMIVFGIAYYIQNRNRYLIETADFNFGETQSLDMEYKTFQQRLIDSFRETLSNLRPQRHGDDMGPVDDSSLRYGVMS